MLLNKFELVKDKLQNLYIIQEDIKYINKPDSKYFENVVSNSDFLYRCYQNNIKLFTIEICKILNKNENGNFFSLIELYLREYKKIKWCIDLPIEELKKLKSTLKEIISSEEFIRLKNARNKYIAHDDINKAKFETTVELKKMWAINRKLQTAFNKINFCHYDEILIFDFTPKPLELQTISKFLNIRSYVFERHKENKDQEDVKNLLNIIRQKS